ncbi:MAG: hypothetical protein ACI9MR_003009 [Myxococcota bacterium]
MRLAIWQSHAPLTPDTDYRVTGTLIPPVADPVTGRFRPPTVLDAVVHTLAGAWPATTSPKFDAGYFASHCELDACCGARLLVNATARSATDDVTFRFLAADMSVIAEVLTGAAYPHTASVD